MFMVGSVNRLAAQVQVLVQVEFRARQNFLIQMKRRAFLRRIWAEVQTMKLSDNLQFRSLSCARVFDAVSKMELITSIWKLFGPAKSSFKCEPDAPFRR